jgi:gas vesicle protein
MLYRRVLLDSGIVVRLKSPLGGNMSDNGSKNIGWFLAGLSLGAIAAILYTPRSGRETREAIVTGMDDGREYLASLGRNARQQVNDWVGSGKKMVDGKKRQINAAIDAAREAKHEAAAEKHS